MRALWQLHRQGAKLQVAEQYWLYPTLAKRLAAVRSGALGTPQFARLSVAHGYHAVSYTHLDVYKRQDRLILPYRQSPSVQSVAGNE